MPFARYHNHISGDNEVLHCDQKNTYRTKTIEAAIATDCTHYPAYRSIFLIIIIPSLTAFFLCPACSAQQDDIETAKEEDIGLFALPFEEMMDIEVISPTRMKGQDVFTSPAAIYVITREDIQRSGHRHIAELLRMVPGLYVGRIDGARWVVASRGFPERFYRMMLVQIDGRTVYSPIFSGVFWEIQDYPLDDIERIEVIRGPGASLWGANAVNGIINIVTKNAKDTQGTLAVGGAGTEERGFTSLRHGGKIGENTFYRFYGKFFEQDKTATYGLPGFTDDRRLSQGGYRFDWDYDPDEHFTLQGDYYDARTGDAIRNADIAAGTNPDVATDTDYDGWNILGRWSKKVSEDSIANLIIYFDRNKLFVNDPSPNFQEQREIFDTDFTYSLIPHESHQIIWGLGYRRTEVEINNVEKVFFTPSGRILNTVSGFVQDTITLVPENLNLIVGTKLEYNELTEFEYQPRGALVWTPNDKNVVWGAVSRAVRVPSLTNDQGNNTLDVLSPDTPLLLTGYSSFVPEEVIAYELGYRVKATERLSLDVASFINDYDKLESAEPIGPTTLQWQNEQDGTAYGVELSAKWQASDRWHLASSYTWFKLTLHGGDETTEDRQPENQFQIRSYYDLTENLELNAELYYYDNNATEDIPSYTRLDLGLTWHATNDLEIGVWGQNLLDEKHPEFGPDRFIAAGGGEIQRGIYGFVKFSF